MKYYLEEMTHNGKVFGLKVCRGEFGFGGQVKSYTTGTIRNASADFSLTKKQQAQVYRIAKEAGEL